MPDTRVTYLMKESNGRKFRVVGTGPTRVLALAEANTKLALTVGQLQYGTVSEQTALGETGTSNAGTVYSDAEITLKHSVSGVLRTIHLENIANSYGDGATGIIDGGAEIDAFAAAYRDGEDAGGYEFYQGHFVK